MIVNTDLFESFRQDSPIKKGPTFLSSLLMICGRRCFQKKLKKKNDDDKDNGDAGTDVKHTDDHLTSTFRKPGHLQSMFLSLNSLTWRRMDVIGRRIFAHTDLVAMHESLNDYGKVIVEHLLEQVRV
jgi:hypothetical protein